MMHVIINRNLYDKDFFGKYCAGFFGLNTLVGEYKPEMFEIITGIPARDIKNAACMLKIHLHILPLAMRWSYISKIFRQFGQLCSCMHSPETLT